MNKNINIVSKTLILGAHKWTKSKKNKGQLWIETDNKKKQKKQKETETNRNLPKPIKKW